jgi:hypothetical protein
MRLQTDVLKIENFCGFKDLIKYFTLPEAVPPATPIIKGEEGILRGIKR